MRRRGWVGLTLLLGALLLGSPPRVAAAAPLRVAVEDLDYLPFHRVGGTQAEGFSLRLLQRFAASQGRELALVGLPLKRLRLARAGEGGFDLVYPDNPAWAARTTMARYSQPLVHIVGATLVLPAQRELSLVRFRVLAAPRGFTPIEWLPRLQDGSVSLLEAAHPAGALELVLRGRADGADVEYNVARHLLQQRGDVDALVVAERLPLSSTAFHVSSVHAPALVEALDGFLQREASWVAELKREYAIVERWPP